MSMTEGLILETCLILPEFEDLFVYSFCISACIFLLNFHFIQITQSFLHSMCSSPQFSHFDSFEHSLVLSLTWSPAL